MMQRPARWVNLGICALLLLTSSASASGGVSPRQWRERVTALDQMARDGKWAAVLAGSDELLGELVHSLSARRKYAEESNRHVLASVLTLRALAAAAFGDERSAAWDWHLAQDLSPPMRVNPPSGYRRVGEILRRHPWTEASERSRYGGVVESDVSPPPTAGEGAASVRMPTEWPEAFWQVQPKYPRVARVERIEGEVVVQTILTESGDLIKPRIAATPAAVFAVAVAEALREQRYDPARLDGQPVALYLNLVVNFELVGRPTVNLPLVADPQFRPIARPVGP